MGAVKTLLHLNDVGFGPFGRSAYI